MGLRRLIARLLQGLARRISPRPAPTRPDANLLDLLIPHVAHELTAMEAATQLWTQTNLWIALEDALLHARLLADFFWPVSDWFGDSAVLAEHYLPAWRANSGGPPSV